ncbi:MAG TPA: iron-sulfur cluster repair di-iron protein [Vicinamibacterales bacterium]|nr:iron-sulfur cluster repair di-iron protein [Vicinamibacterales bacterium]
MNEATTNDTTTTLADLAVAHPAAARVFYANGLDFCCGGRRPFVDACREHGLDPDAILDEIRRADAVAAPAARWDLVPLTELTDHIVTYYHRRLRAALPHLVDMARMVEARHGDKVSCPVGLTALLEQVQQSTFDHLDKEEAILFPAIARRAGAIAGPVSMMELEHEHHKDDLQRIRTLTSQLTPPAAACTTWRALYAGLQQFEQELMEHIHLENNVLFRRALAASATHRA